MSKTKIVKGDWELEGMTSRLSFLLTSWVVWSWTEAPGECGAKKWAKKTWS